MKNFSLAVVIILVIVLAGAAVAQDKNPICQNAIPPSAPFDDDTANCKYRGKIHMGPSGGSPYQYDEKGSSKDLFPSGSGYITCTFNYYVCGDHFFKGKVINVNAGEKCPEWNVEYREICCDKWEEAKRTKQPCDVMLDADCDGMPNAEDDRPTQAPINWNSDIAQIGGSIFISAPSGKAVGRQGPDDSCSEVAHFTQGARLVYRRVVFNKKTGEPDWYLVEPPSGRPGWLPARDTSNTRPPPPPPRPPKVNPPPSPVFPEISTGYGGARGRPNTSSGNRRGTRRGRPKRTSKKP